VAEPNGAVLHVAGQVLAIEGAEGNGGAAGAADEAITEAANGVAAGVANGTTAGGHLQLVANITTGR
jgi:hypothetical protein